MKLTSVTIIIALLTLIITYEISAYSANAKVEITVKVSTQNEVEEEHGSLVAQNCLSVLKKLCKFIISIGGNNNEKDIVANSGSGLVTAVPDELNYIG